MKKEIKIISAVLLQIMIILAIVIFKVLILQNGTDVLLHIAPVDPRDPLRGDYLTFNYDNVSTVDDYYGSSNKLIRDGDTVYVPLDKSGTYWRANTLSKDPPTAMDKLFLKGIVVSGGMQNNIVPSDYSYQYRSYRIKYGIEDYYIPEGAGNHVVTDFLNKQVTASVHIDDNGNAVLKKIFVDGKEWPK